MPNAKGRADGRPDTVTTVAPPSLCARLAGTFSADASYGDASEDAKPHGGAHHAESNAGGTPNNRSVAPCLGTKQWMQTVCCVMLKSP